MALDIAEMTEILRNNNRITLRTMAMEDRRRIMTWLLLNGGVIIARSLRGENKILTLTLITLE